MSLRRRIELFLEHSLVNRADGELGTAENRCAHVLGLAEGEFGDRVADAALDALLPIGHLRVPLALAPGESRRRAPGAGGRVGAPLRWRPPGLAPPPPRRLPREKPGEGEAHAEV